MKFDTIKNAVVKIANVTGLKIQKYSPEILLGIGAVGVIGATVLACKETLKVNDILDEHAEVREKIEMVSKNEELCAQENYTPEDKKKAVAKLYIQTGLKIAKNYAASAALMATSLACIFTGFGILKTRNASLLAAYNAAQQAMTAYRERVKSAVGEEKENDIYAGRLDKKIDIIEKDKDGKEKKFKDKKKVFSDDPTQYSRWARFFDETMPQWDAYHGNRELILKHLECQQAIWTERLRSRGYVTYNELIEEEFGLPTCQDGYLWGWVNDGKTTIDFGIYSGSKSSVRFINGYSDAVLMDFNPTYIFDKFERYQNI